MTASETDSTATELPTITLTEPMPGLGDHTEFHLVPVDDIGAIYSLRTTSDPNRLLILAAAPVFHPDYAPVVDDDTCDKLDLHDAADAAVFLVVNAAESLIDSTVNLMAPVIINTANHRGQQVVLTGKDHDLRAPLIGGQQ